MPAKILYRAVAEAELQDIAVTGLYRAYAGSSEGKYFFDSADDAVRFARKMFRLFPDEGAYTITAMGVSTAQLSACARLRIAGEGLAWFVPPPLLPLGPVEIWTYCPV